MVVEMFLDIGDCFGDGEVVVVWVESGHGVVEGVKITR